MDEAALRRATARNHRACWRLRARATGGTGERIAGVEVIRAEGGATVAFPRPDAPLELVLRRLRRVDDVAVWSLRPSPTLDARLAARGFVAGEEPHWMALDLARPIRAAAGVRVEEAPRGGSAALRAMAEVRPRRASHLAVREDGRVVGEALLVLGGGRGVAGLYDLRVVGRARRRGLGRALALAAAARARALGAAWLTLNASPEGEPLYDALGFRSLGRGATWRRA